MVLQVKKISIANNYLDLKKCNHWYNKVLLDLEKGLEKKKVLTIFWRMKAFKASSG